MTGSATVVIQDTTRDYDGQSTFWHVGGKSPKKRQILRKPCTTDSYSIWKSLTGRQRLCSWSNYGGGYAEKHEHSEQPVDLEDELSVGWCV